MKSAISVCAAIVIAASMGGAVSAPQRSSGKTAQPVLPSGNLAIPPKPVAPAGDTPSGDARNAPIRLANHQCRCANPIQVGPLTQTDCQLNYRPRGGDSRWTSSNGGTCWICYYEDLSNCAAGHQPAPPPGGNQGSNRTGGNTVRYNTRLCLPPGTPTIFSRCGWTGCITLAELQGVQARDTRKRVEDQKVCP